MGRNVAGGYESRSEPKGRVMTASVEGSGTLGERLIYGLGVPRERQMFGLSRHSLR